MPIRAGKRFFPSLIVAAGTLTIMAIGVVPAAPTAGAATSSWSSMSTPFLAPGFNQLVSVSCAPGTVKFCVAVGSTSPPPKDCTAKFGCVYGPSTPLMEVWTGSWKITKPPTPSNPISFFTVSCSSPTHCMALGVAGPDAGFADVWTVPLGRSWRAP